MNTDRNLEDKIPKKRKYRFVRRLLRVLFGFLFFLIILIFFIRSPWGQSIIVSKVVTYVSNKTNTKVAIDKLFITFDGNLKLDGLFLEDKKRDTLVYSKSLEANIPLLKIIKGEALGVDNLDWIGLRANIIRKDSISGYNFQFIIDAFASTDTTETLQKDSIARPLNIFLKNLNFKDFTILFKDEVAGIGSEFKIGQLKASLDTINIEEFIFKASEIEVSDTDLKLIQKLAKVDTNTTDSPLPKFSIGEFALKNVTASIELEPSNTISQVNLKDFYTEIPLIDLEKNIFNLNVLNLKNSEILVHNGAFENNLIKDAAANVNSSNSTTPSFQWPKIKTRLADLNLENNRINYRVGPTKPQKDIFNSEAISIENSILKVSDLYLEQENAGFTLNQFSFQEISGIDLKKLSFNFKITDKELVLSALDLQLNNNTITGNARLNYSGISQFLKTPEATKFALNIPSFNISTSDAFKFQSALKNNKYLKTLNKNNLTGRIQALGTLDSISVSQAEINWGKSTQILANGILTNLIKPKELYVDMSAFSVKTTRTDLVQFVNEKDLGIQLPEQVLLSGNGKGTIAAVTSQVKLTTSHGLATLDAHIKNGKEVVYDANLAIENYKLNELLNNPQLGALSMQLESKGSGKNLNALNATLEATISQFKLNNYNLRNLNITGAITNGKGELFSKYKDENINLNLNGSVLLDSIATEINTELDIVGANLQGLGLLRKAVKTGMKISANFKGNTETFDADATIDDGVLVYENRTYLLGDFNAFAHVTKDTTAFSLKNKMIELQLNSNANPQSFSTSLQRHIVSYFYRDKTVPDTLTNPVNLVLKGKISQSPLLNDVFLANVNDLDTINIAIDFHERARKLNAYITAPHINYAGNELDSLTFKMDTDTTNFNFNFGFKNITAGPINIPSTKIIGSQTNNELSLSFVGNLDGDKILNVEAEITGNRERLVFKVLPDDIIFNKSSWHVPPTNEVVITEGNIKFNNFVFSKQNQSVELTNKLANNTKDHAALVFKNYNINELFYYLNPKIKLASGILNTALVLEEPFEDPRITANLKIEQFEILKTKLGTLDFTTKLGTNNAYDLNAGLKGGAINLDLGGDYRASGTESNINLDIALHAFKMEALNNFSFGELKEGKGTLSGQFNVSGSTSNPQYKGQLNFNEASFNIAKLNTGFTMLQETLEIDNSGLTMSDFTIHDEAKNPLVFSGNIGTESFSNPSFNLTIKANNFQVLNASKEENNLMYGKATFDANGKLTGDLNLPKLDAKLALGSKTNITYVLPTDVANIENRDGVVYFVNRENPDAILTQTEEKSALIKGFDISTAIKIPKDAIVTVIIDEATGDNFSASGQGDLIFTMAPNGIINLVGNYEIASGHYELNLYNLVNRKFSLAKGSTVSWAGDPFDAKLEVRAIYNVETSASSLMASQISGTDTSVQNKYEEVLPFLVYLNVNGELLQPNISFSLDMPEDKQGAIGGQVYSRMQQVNQQEGELNQQVFSLLVLNRFYSNTSSDGSSGGFETLARNNLNDAISDQLNSISNKALGKTGIQLDLGIDSYTDYQGDTPTDRTQLEIAAQKKLFDDRLIVRVGSEVDIQGESNTNSETAPIIGNVALEYILTKDGRYRLKGFRKNEFENVIDGQTIVSGIALIFTQEFNQFSELWDAIFHKQKETKEVKETKNNN